MRRRDLDSALHHLKAALVLLDRLVSQSTTTVERVREALQVTEGPMSTQTVCLLVRKRRCDVVATLKLLEAAGEVRRTAKGWESTGAGTHDQA